MSTRSTNLRRPSGSLSIFPPSPSAVSHPTITTPINPTTFSTTAISSPRRAPLPPSPTHSTTYSTANVPWLDERSRSNSLDVPREVPPVPHRSEKRLPFPTSGPSSPHRREGKGGYAGAYDNKLVSSTLSHLPPLPPLSPTPTGNSLPLSTHSAHHHTPPSHLLHPPTTSNPSYPHLASNTPRPSIASQSSSSGVVVLPDGTALPTSSGEHNRGGNEPAGPGRNVHETLLHSSASSPWSLLTVHVLPLFAGGPLKTPIEDLNQLCNSHIMATSQRAPPSRIVAVLSSDLRDFIGSGMLTLKAKFETLEEAKIVARAAEVWSFFWAQVLPYLEGVFLPFTQVRDLPPSASTSSQSTSVNAPPIGVRHLLLSGFLLHILLPLLSRLIPLITTSNSTVSPPNTPDLQRILQMSLVLSTQAKYSSLFPLHDASENYLRDEEIRDNVESLGKAVRWRMSMTSDGSPQAHTAQRQSLQRGPSMNQGRNRRRGWRASTYFGQQWGAGPDPILRQNSDDLQAPETWEHVDDENEDDTSTPGQSYARSRQGDASYATTTGSTLTAGTMRGEGQASYGRSQHTPQAEFGMRRPNRSESSGSSEVNGSVTVRR